MERLAIFFAVFALAGCAVETPPPAGEGRAMRIVSLDYCADQYVLKLADRTRILAVSPHAEAPYSYMRAAAAGVPKVRPRAEDVLILQPDLIVRSYGGGPNAEAFFARAGVPVLTVGWSATLDDVATNLERMAEGLGEAERGKALADEMRGRLATLEAKAGGGSALYFTPAGVSTGAGSLVHEMLVAGGYSNFETRPGWHAIPLERLAYETPDMVVSAVFEGEAQTPDRWGAAQHPVAARVLSDVPSVPVQGAWTSCGAWFLMDAVEALAQEEAG